MARRQDGQTEIEKPNLDRGEQVASTLPVSEEQIDNGIYVLPLQVEVRFLWTATSPPTLLKFCCDGSLS